MNEKKKSEKCNKKCEHYANGMCFKDPKRVKIMVVGDACKWDEGNK